MLADKYHDKHGTYNLAMCTGSFHLGVTSARRYLKNPKKVSKYFKFTEKDRPSNSYKKLSKKYNKNEEEIVKFAMFVYAIAINELRDLKYSSNINIYFVLEAIFQLGVTLALYEK